MLYSLLSKNLLKPALATPGNELPAVIGEDLTRRTPLPDRSLEHLQYCIRVLLPEQPPTHQVARMIVDDPDQIDRVHPLEMEGEDVHLPHRVGTRALEAPRRHPTPVWLGWRITQLRIIDYCADLLCADLDPFMAPQLVSDPTDSVLRILPPKRHDLLFQH